MRLTHKERAKRRADIAAYCVSNGIAKACLHFGCSVTLVREACKEAGVAPPEAEPDPTRLQLITALVSSSAPFAALAVRFGCSPQAVSKFAERCVKAGLPVRKRNKGRVAKGRA